MSWAVVLFCILFLVPSFYSRSLTTSLVVCNLCYEGSLIAASCNFSLLNEKRAILPDREKNGISNGQFKQVVEKEIPAIEKVK